MEQAEVQFLQHGQLNLRNTSETANVFRLAMSEPKALIPTLSDILGMLRNPREMFLSYIRRDVFRGMTEEKFISVIPATEFFKGAIGQLRLINPNVTGLTVSEECGRIKFQVLLKQPDLDLEIMIYNKFAELSDQYKKQNFDIEIKELFK